MKDSRFVRAALLIASLLFLASCGGGQTSSTTPSSQQQMGNVFTLGTDAAPTVPSVVSFTVTISSVTLSDGTTTANLLGAPETLDFARFQGLHELLDLQDVPTGTYTQATVTLSSPVIGFLDTSVNPPILNSMNGQLTQSTVTVTLPKPLVLNDSDMVGLFMDLDLRQSLTTDANGNVTPMVNPRFDIHALSADDAEASIDDFVAGVVSVSGSSFVIQGPHGRKFTVMTDNSTEFDSGEGPSSFDTNTIVEVSGNLNRVTRNIDASEVEVLSKDKFFVGGLFTSIRPAGGQANQVDLYTRTELPDLSGVPLGQINTFGLTGSESYMIANIRLPLTTLLFGPSTLAAGQRVALGGTLNTSNGSTTLTVHRVVLRRQGQQGSWVPSSTMIQSRNNGSFQMNDNFLAGVLLPSPLTVITTNFTNFVNLNGLSDLSGTQPIPIRVVGFVLVDPATGKPVLVARRVEKLS